MRIALAVLLSAALASPSLVSSAQSPAGGTPQRVALPAPSSRASSITALMQPSLDAVLRTLDSLRVDKWKRGSIRDEASANIDTIQHDVRVNLPPLLSDADASSGTIGKMLPLSRHVNALYDVLLRVAEASRVIAPDEQAAQLQQALTTLGSARLALGDRIQGSADALEKQVIDLRATIQTEAARRQAAPAPAALPCVPPTPHRTATKARKTPAKPASKPSPATPATPATSNPSK